MQHLSVVLINCPLVFLNWPSTNFMLSVVTNWLQSVVVFLFDNLQGIGNFRIEPNPHIVHLKLKTRQPQHSGFNSRYVLTALLSLWFIYVWFYLKGWALTFDTSRICDVDYKFYLPLQYDYVQRHSTGIIRSQKYTGYLDPPIWRTARMVEFMYFFIHRSSHSSF